jgi:prephenate dehydrogenase
VPHLLSALIAGTLAGAPPHHLALSGQGVRDVTRVAGGDPALYSQIIGANAPAVTNLLAELQQRLDLAVDAVTSGDRDGLASLLAHGVAGTRAIPGKHGGPPEPTATLWIAVPDHPGELARLFADAGESEVNIEDVRIDHDPGRPVGLVELDVAADRAAVLLEALESKGWDAHR